MNRAFFDHDSPLKRTITDEITLLNSSDTEIPSIFILKTEFMVGLKVYDETNQELSFYTNQMTRNLINEVQQYQQILDEINTQQSFVIWIRLPDEKKIASYQTKIIKLVYKNSTSAKDYQKTSFKKLKQLRFLFSLPTYPIIYSKNRGIKHDVFYIIEVPYEYKIDYEILEKNKVLDNGALEELDKVYVDGHDNVISVRLPPVEEPIRFEMVYDIIPKRNEKIFYTALLISLISLSILFLLLNTKLLNYNAINFSDIFPLKHIYYHLNPLLGGIVTLSSVTIGFMKNYSTDKTRFWFLIPIIICAIAFLFKV